MQHPIGDWIEESTDLGLLWHMLAEGRLFISRADYVDGRCHALLEARSGRSPAPAACVQILERVFEGESQKAIACELGVSVGTVAGYCQRALSAFMPGQWVSRVPILVAMAALAAHGERGGQARCEDVVDSSHWVISVEVPGKSFRDRLSSAELEVARLSIEGEPHAAVAQRRGTSVRTVANQLAATFGKLKVSGRSELRAKAIRELAQQQQTTPPPGLASVLIPSLMPSSHVDEQLPQIASVA